MIRKAWMGVAGLVLSLGVSAPAFAHGDYDEHDDYHRERTQEHALEHQQLEAEHEDAHSGLEQEHARLHALGYGNDPFSHWMMHRRLARQHRMEHIREWLQHEGEHRDAASEHQRLHQQFDPYGYGGNYAQPDYAPRYWSR